MLYEPLSVCDPEIANLIELERERQFDGLELIASEVIKCELKSISIF
jgi:glycine/serine hydroxymethyltransferase